MSQPTITIASAEDVKKFFTGSIDPVFERAIRELIHEGKIVIARIAPKGGKRGRPRIAAMDADVFMEHQHAR